MKSRRLEERRFRAVRLLQEGTAAGKVAHLVGVTPAAVLQWRSLYRKKGWDGLHAGPRLGAKSRLNPESQKRLLEMLALEPGAFGLALERWSLAGVAELIRLEFSIRYHPAHVWRILRRLGWSLSKIGVCRMRPPTDSPERR